jgi:hypothetical protein
MKNLLTNLFLLISIIISAQNELYFEKLEIHDKVHSLSFAEYKPIDKNYPLSNLFDSDFKTCHIIAKGDEYRTVWIKLPKKEKININIFSGYGKSKALYYQNARAKKLHISLYYGFLPEGYYSENTFEYQITDLHKVFDINLKDIFGVQTFSFPIKADELTYIKKRAINAYNKISFPKAEKQGFFIAISVDEIYKGTKYNDVCISELFFNQAFITKNRTGIQEIDSIYINDEGNAVYINTKKRKNIFVYQKENSVLDIMEIAQNNEWAIIISMETEIGKRTEVNYILLDLLNKKQVNNDLKIHCQDYHSGNDIYFEQIGNKLFLKYAIQDEFYNFVELKHSK